MNFSEPCPEIIYGIGAILSALVYPFLPESGGEVGSEVALIATSGFHLLLKAGNAILSADDHAPTPALVLPCWVFPLSLATFCVSNGRRVLQAAHGGNHDEVKIWGAVLGLSLSLQAWIWMAGWLGIGLTASVNNALILFLLILATLGLSLLAYKFLSQLFLDFFIRFSARRFSTWIWLRREKTGTLDEAFAPFEEDNPPEDVFMPVWSQALAGLVFLFTVVLDILYLAA